MAINKEKEHKGYTAEYWRLIEWNSHIDRMQTVVTVALYKDKDSRDEDKIANILETRQEIIPLVEGGRKAVYLALRQQKTLPVQGEPEKNGYFVDATDVLENE